MTVRLPWPPTVNHYWRRTEGHGLAISDRGLQFRQEVIAAFLEQFGAGWRARFDPKARYRLRIAAAPPDHRRRDLDNVLKALLDSLENARVFDDDAQVDDLHIVRGKPTRGGELVVTIREAA